MTIKKFNSEHDQQQFLNLNSYAFNYTRTAEHDKRSLDMMKHCDLWGAFDEDHLTSQIMVLPYRAKIGTQDVKMAGIGSVATYPENRGNGGIRALFKDIFKELEEKEVPLSYLAPFSQPFYRKFGYETVFETISGTLTRETVTQLPFTSEGSIKRVDKNAPEWRDVLKKLYSETLGKDFGAVVRDDWWWEAKLTRKIDEVAIVFDNLEEPVGYLMYKMEGSQFIIKELAYKTKQALYKLNGFISSHSGTFETFHYTASLLEKMTLLFPECRVLEQKIEQDMMVKIVLFDKFMAAYPFNPTANLSVSLAIEDNSSDYNNGTWQLTIKNGEASCQKLSNDLLETADFSGPIQKWTQVFMGHSKFNSHIFLEYITVNSKEKVKDLWDSIPNVTPCLYDYF